jgi:hypothetical protein
MGQVGSSKKIPLSHIFRLRVNRAPSCTISTDLSKVCFPTKEGGISVSLRAPSTEQSIRDAERWALFGEGYASEEEALRSGTNFQNALMVALAKMRVGVDFGDRAPKGHFTAHGLRGLEEGGQRVLNNVHGLMAYASEPKPTFAAVDVKGVREVDLGSFETEFCAAVAAKPSLSDRQRVAFNLFNASFFQPTDDSRFVMLMMAAEALIKPNSTSPAVNEQVESFVDQTKNSSLEANEKNSLIGSLNRLREESINQAGRRLATERLSGRTYRGKSAASFFSDTYKLRSTLVHGGVPFPSLEEVRLAVGPLEIFVSDLLTALV